MTRIERVIPILVLLAACGELSRTPGATDAGPVPDAGSPRATCSACARPAFSCVLGECRGSCVPGTGAPSCEGELRCVDGACLPPVPPSCEEQACNVDQYCLSTYCVQAGHGTCDSPGPSGCGTQALCDEARRHCVLVPPCDVEGNCRAGDVGAVCNRRVGGVLMEPGLSEGYCLIGRCASDDDCPPGKRCEGIGDAGPVLGGCR